MTNSATSGNSGFIKLHRSQPEPIILPPSTVDVANNRFTLTTDDYWDTDYVTLLTANTTIKGYLYQDELDRFRLFPTAETALNKLGASVDLAALSTDIVILIYESTETQETILTSLAGTLTSILKPTPLRKYEITYASFYTNPVKQYKFLANIEKYSLNRSAKSVDLSVLGEKYTRAATAAISGSGDIEALVNMNYTNLAYDSKPLLNLLQVLDTPLEHSSMFFLRSNSTDTVEESDILQCGSQTYGLGELYYDASIVFTGIATSVDPDNILRLAADFITTGPIRLRSKLNYNV